MWIPVLRGVIDRRMLVNYRVDPEIMQRCLPHPFRPKIVNGVGMAGVCLIRMKQLGPPLLPFPIFRTSENGALRFAVEWEQDGQPREGVYIPARYTTSRVAAFAGTRFFPGRHYMAQFQVTETEDRLQIQLQSSGLQMSVVANVAEKFQGSKVFSSLDDVSAFFRSGAYGYSEAMRSQKFDGVELHVADWKVIPLNVERVSCDYFDDVQRFPPGTAELDNALLMRGRQIEFHGLRSFCCLFPPEKQPIAA